MAPLVKSEMDKAVRQAILYGIGDTKLTDLITRRRPGQSWFEPARWDRKLRWEADHDLLEVMS